MRCYRARGLLRRKAAESLSDSQERRLEEHLGACLACSKLTEEIERAWAALGHLPTVEPSADFLPRLKARLREEDTSSRQGTGPVRSWRWVAVAACVLLAAVFAARFETGRQNPSPEERTAVSARDSNVPDEQFLQDLEEILQQSDVDFLSAYDVWPAVPQDAKDRGTRKAGEADGSKKKERPS
ncbi:MAG: hypothetical protein H6Q05_629 [Acidobacteria bacterium]|nr:hypothetical protein [Acidobacteriota bacterium]